MTNEPYLNLDDKAKLIAIANASEEVNKIAYFLKKDIWIVWTLKQLFEAPFGNNLVFKGGTSLSKTYGVIYRFSKDIDITYDIREIARDLTKDVGVLPKTTSQAKNGNYIQ